jgi:hypothetical protein
MFWAKKKIRLSRQKSPCLVGRNLNHLKGYRFDISLTFYHLGWIGDIITQNFEILKSFEKTQESKKSLGWSVFVLLSQITMAGFLFEGLSSQ